MSRKIAKLVEDWYERLVEAASLVHATPGYLEGKAGLSKEEDPPKQALLQRHDIRDIVDRVIDDVEPLVGIAFRCSLLLSGLLTQGKVLLPRKKTPTGSSKALHEYSSNDLEGLAEQLDTGLKTLLGLQKRLASGECVVGFNYQTLPFSGKDTYVRGMYEISYLKRRVRETSSTSV